MLARPCARSINIVGFRRSTRYQHARLVSARYSYVGPRHRRSPSKRFTTECPSGSSVPPLTRGAQLPPAPHAQQRPCDKASRVQGAGRHVRRVIQLRARVKRPDRRLPGGLTGLTNMVHGRRARHVANVETAVTEPSTQVSVFPIQKSAHRNRQSRRTRLAVRACTRRITSRRRHSRHPCERLHRLRRYDARRREMAAGSEARPYDRKAPSACPDHRVRFLHLAIGIENPWSHHGTGRLGVEHGSQRG